MAIDNEKLVTLGGLAEYHKSVPDTAKAAMLLMMSESSSLSEEPLIAQHVVGYNWIGLTGESPIQQLTVPTGAKYFVVEYAGGTTNNLQISNLRLYHEGDDTYMSYTDFSDISDCIPINPFDMTTSYPGPWGLGSSPTVYISTSNESLASYEDNAKFGLVNMPAGTFSYDSDGKILNCRCDHLSEYGKGIITSKYDSDHTTTDESGNTFSNDPIIGICRVGMDSEQDLGFKKAISVYRNPFSGEDNSGIIPVESGKSYYLHGFNIATNGNAYVRVFWFDNYGCARMASYDKMIDAETAYKTSHPNS